MGRTRYWVGSIYPIFAAENDLFYRPIYYLQRPVSRGLVLACATVYSSREPPLSPSIFIGQVWGKWLWGTVGVRINVLTYRYIDFVVFLYSPIVHGGAESL